MDIRILKIDDSEKRVETGPVQFNKDWPGLFIRGDGAFGFAGALKHVLDNNLDDHPQTREVVRLYLEELYNLLDETNVKHREEKKSRDHNTANNKHPQFLHKFKTRDKDHEHPAYSFTLRTQFYDRLEDIPQRSGPWDYSMYDDEIYELTPVPSYLLHTIQRKKKRNERYEQYLKLKQEFENTDKENNEK